MPRFNRVVVFLCMITVARGFHVRSWRVTCNLSCRHGLHDMNAYAKYMEGAVDNIIHTDEQLHQVSLSVSAGRGSVSWQK